MISELPFSQACENNKSAILKQLKRLLLDVDTVLEIGSGTAQHAVYFAENLPHLLWQTSDLAVNHSGINARLAHYELENLLPPILFEIGVDQWPCKTKAVFTANTTHIMQPSQAEMMLKMIAENLPRNGVFCQYGPFNINGSFTSDSNEQFNRHLLSQGCGGLRDIEELQAWVADTDLVLQDNIEMPANNRLLVWKKS